VLHYPKIPSTEGCPGGRCIAFEKIDGTNLHWSWDRDFGWHAFGTRRDEFNLTLAGIDDFRRAHPGLDDCADLFESLLAEELDRIFREQPDQADHPAFKVFTEYAGPRSFAGQHHPDDNKTLVLFDVLAEDYGLIGPEKFVEDFGHLPIPRVIFRGRFSGRLTEAVRRGDYRLAEGVVVKGGSGGDDLWMAKIKTNDYRERLQRMFEERWLDYWE
jgi:hypothetical protein